MKLIGNQFFSRMASLRVVAYPCTSLEDPSQCKTMAELAGPTFIWSTHKKLVNLSGLADPIKGARLMRNNIYIQEKTGLDLLFYAKRIKVADASNLLIGRSKESTYLA